MGQRAQGGGRSRRPGAPQRQAAGGRRSGRPGQGGQGRASRATPARRAAVDALAAIRERDAFAQDVIASTIDGSALPPEEKAFATRLVLGTVSARGTLDEVLDSCLDSPRDVSERVRDALALSAYELLYLGKAEHAAVDQGVELVRAVAPRAAGLANVVLRRLAKARPSFPFGDPTRDLAAYARLHAFPEWLAKRLVEDLGPQGAQALMVASNQPAPLFVAVNALRASDEEVAQVLAKAKAAPEPVAVAGRPVAGCLRLSSAAVLSDGRVQRLLADGKMLVSDAASQAIAQMVADAASDGPFLEVGAGRGTKTILIQSDRFRATGAQLADYWALDAHRFKVELLAERAQDCGARVAEACVGDGARLEEAVGERTFATVFVDAPCTGLGTLRRHVDIRWRLRPETIAEHAQLDGRLLASAAARVAPGGLLAYSTCTVAPEENERAVEAFLASAAGEPFALEEPVAGEAFFRTALMPGGCDAHFLALMRRAS